MSIAAVPYYNNFTATYRLAIQLIHDVETNPCPDSYSVGLNQHKNSTHLKIAHLNARSLKNQHHYLLIKETISCRINSIFLLYARRGSTVKLPI